MEDLCPMMITTLLLLVMVLVGKVVQNMKMAKNRQKMPPGRRGWPIIGDSLNWYNAVASSHPPQFVEHQVKRYGKIFSCRLFGKMAVVSADPSFNRFVMQNEGKLFQSSYPKSFRDLVGKNGVITAQGDLQRKLHGIASNMIRQERLKSHFLNDIQIAMMDAFSDFHDNGLISLQDVCRKVTINLMVKQLLGMLSESEINQMAQSFSDFVDGCLSLPINLPGCAYHTAMKAREKIINKINKTIEKRREEGTSEDGVVGRLMEEESLPDEAIADFIINLLFAGIETTSKTMLFAIYFLSHSSEAMEHLLEEHDGLRRGLDGNGREMVAWDEYKSMSFTQCVIDETLRVGGIAIWLMRAAKEDVVYQDYVIPKGCLVVPFLSAVHLDEKVYKGALRFNPWRWMEPQNEDKRNWRTSSVYAPFGGGARLCPGADLARLQIALFLHYFLTSFRWRQVKEDSMSFFPSARLLNGFQICLTRRQPREQTSTCL